MLLSFTIMQLLRQVSFCSMWVVRRDPSFMVELFFLVSFIFFIRYSLSLSFFLYFRHLICVKFYACCYWSRLKFSFFLLSLLYIFSFLLPFEMFETTTDVWYT